MRRLLALLLIASAGCSSSPKPKPPPPPPPPPPPVVEEEPPPEPSEIVAVSNIRSVETEVVTAEVTKNLGERLISSLGPRARALDVSGSNDEKGCITESCQLEAATAQSATQLLHTRLIQYEGQCVLVSVLYDVESRRGQWGFSTMLPCDVNGLNEKASEVANAFSSRSDGNSAAPAVFAVVPVQHRLPDLVWATESFGEYLSTQLAVAGLPIVPASFVASKLEKEKDTHRACGTEKCALKLGAGAQADRSVAVEIRARGKTCSVTASTYDVASKKRLLKSVAKGGCTAPEIVSSFDQIAKELIEASANEKPKKKKKKKGDEEEEQLEEKVDEEKGDEKKGDEEKGDEEKGDEKVEDAPPPGEPVLPPGDDELVEDPEQGKEKEKKEEPEELKE